jgi:Ca2+/H+ antiporter
MKKYNLKLIWLWVMGIAITTAIIITIIDIQRLLQNGERFKLFMRIIILCLISLSLFFQINDYRKLIKKEAGKNSE